MSLTLTASLSLYSSSQELVTPLTLMSQTSCCHQNVSVPRSSPQPSHLPVQIDEHVFPTFTSDAYYRMRPTTAHQRRTSTAPSIPSKSATSSNVGRRADPTISAKHRPPSATQAVSHPTSPDIAQAVSTRAVTLHWRHHESFWAFILLGGPRVS